MTVADLLAAIEVIAPARMAFEWDHIGLQVGSPTQTIARGVTCLDLTLDKARSLAPNTAVVVHHPLIWNPLTSIRTDHDNGAIIAELLRKDGALIAAHTNWDAAAGGINDTLAARLGLTDIVPFGASSPVKQFKLAVFVPPSALESIFEAAAKPGAGTIGDYDQCSFRSVGEGTFRGSQGTKPAIGQAGRLERVDEVRLEMLVPMDRRQKVEAAVRKAHPYEEPAMDWSILVDGPGQSLGRLGHLPSVMPLSDFRELVDENLGTRSQVTGAPDRPIRKVAVIGGAAGDEVSAAHRAGADVYVTGEFKHHELIAASSAQLATVEAGHYATEHPGMEALRDRLAAALPKVSWSCLASEPGQNGSSW